MGSKLVSPDFPGWVRKQAGPGQQPDLLPGHMCSSHVLSSFFPSENSVEKPHHTLTVKRCQGWAWHMGVFIRLLLCHAL